MLTVYRKGNNHTLPCGTKCDLAVINSNEIKQYLSDGWAFSMAEFLGDDVTEVKVDVKPKPKSLDDLSDDEIKAKAKKLGIRIGRSGREKLIKAINDAL